MKNQVLTIRQMESLQTLGLDTSKASCRWEQYGADEIVNGNVKFVWGIPQLALGFNNNLSCCTNYKCWPAFTLQDLLDKIPCYIKSDGGGIFRRTIEGAEYMYYEITDDSDGEQLFLPICGKTLLDTSYNMLCYLLKNGYVR